MNLESGFTRPDYAGRSIANIPAGIAALLGIPFAGLPALSDELWQPLGRDVQRVVLLLVDGFGWNLFERLQADLAWLTRRAVVRGRLTSIFPSTTVAALSSVWSGLAPAGHGLVGLNLLFPQFGTLGQMLKLSPLTVKQPDALLAAGLKPETFLAGRGLAEQFAESGVPTVAFKGLDIVDSALSKMHGRGVKQSVGVVTTADMFVLMRDLLEKTAGQPLYVSAYWPAVDMLSHIHGWDHPTVAAEVRAVFQLLEQELWRPLSAAGRAQTALLVVADHGQALTPADKFIFLDDHPALQEMLLLRPAGESRAPYFYARPGRQAEIMAYVQRHLSQAAVPISSAEALAAGLFGPPPFAPDTTVRLGDVVLLMREGYAFFDPAEREKATQMKSRHGGLAQAEMEVPWLGFRLDRL